MTCVPGYTMTPRFLNVGLHEEGHTFQAQVLGILFIPAYFVSGGMNFESPNIFEQAANDYADGSGSWWPWSNK